MRLARSHTSSQWCLRGYGCMCLSCRLVHGSHTSTCSSPQSSSIPRHLHFLFRRRTRNDSRSATYLTYLMLHGGDGTDERGERRRSGRMIIRLGQTIMLAGACLSVGGRAPVEHEALARLMLRGSTSPSRCSARPSQHLIPRWAAAKAETWCGWLVLAVLRRSLPT